MSATWDRLSRRSTAQFLAAAFLFYGLAATAMLSFLMPPYQNPDEPSHFMRAAQIATGSLLGARNAGNDIQTSDPNIMLSRVPFRGIQASAANKTTALMYEEATKVAWSDDLSRQYVYTAAYPPFFYLPAALAISIGRTLSLPVISSLYLARILTGIASVLIASLAIYLSGGASAWIFSILALPMTLSQMTACSQDGLALSLSALFVALIAPTVMKEIATSRQRFMLSSAVLSFVAMSRPPYAFLSLMLFVVPGISLRLKVTGAFAVVAVTISWAVFAGIYAEAPTRPGFNVNVAEQLRHMMAHPLAFPAAMARSALHSGGFYLESFIGRLGWVDVTLSPIVLIGTGIMVALSSLTIPRFAPASPPPRFATAVTPFLSVIFSCTAIFGAIYLSYTEVGAPMIEGVTGRYFLPIALCLAIALYYLPRMAPPIHNRLIFALIPLISLSETIRATTDRYYS
jgi:uncharacterized membrane protein